MQYETFEAFMKAVDVAIDGLCGFTHRDIADWHWRDAYRDEADPYDAAVEALTAEGFSDYLDGTSGQDRESYTDTQDRDSYTVDGSN